MPHHLEHNAVLFPIVFPNNTHIRWESVLFLAPFDPRRLTPKLLSIMDDGQNGGARHGQAEQSNGSASGPDTAKGGKGKERDTTFGDRLQASGQMAFNAVIGSQRSLPSAGDGKASASTGSTNRNEVPVSEATLAESSGGQETSRLGDSIRHRELETPKASAQYEQFLDATPIMQDIPRHDPPSVQRLQSQSFREQAARDGEDVVQLLSMPDEEPNYSEFDEFLSEDEAARLHAALFSGGSSHLVLDRLLNFEPDFLHNPARVHETISHLGTEDPEIAHGVWLQQWYGVLNSYTDEVWGDLRALVKEARQEIEEVESSVPHTDTRTPESKALERLRQILAHVRGHV